MRITLTATSFAMLCLAAGCGDSHDAIFGAETDEELRELVDIARGEIIGESINVAEFALSQAQEGPCPALEESGNETTISGGCTDDLGIEYSGEVRINSSASGVLNRIALVDFGLRFEGDSLFADGSVELPSADDSVWRYQADVSILISNDGVLESRSMNATLECNLATESCRWEGASASHHAVGSFALEGGWSENAIEGGLVELEGENTMTINFGQDFGCDSVVVDGQRREVCD